MPSTPALLAALAQVVGAGNVLTAQSGHGDLAAYQTDWRKRSCGLAKAIIRPGATKEVADVVRLCLQHQAATGLSIVPQGGNTGLVVGSTPDASGLQIVLSLNRMNTVRAIDPANLTMTAEAGCVLQAVQQAANAAGLLFPLSLAAQGSCTIGGNLATNAGGTQVLRYGNARSLCLGLEVVTAQGQVWHGLSGLRKDNTGYDLQDLFIGSEGTLGIITAATLKLVPAPLAHLTAWAAVPSLDAALGLLALAQRQLGAGLTGFEVMGQFALSLVARHFTSLRVPLFKDTPWCVLLETSDHESALHAQRQFDHLFEAALEAGVATDAVVAQSLAQSQALWQVREGIPLAQAQEGLNIKHDISLPISCIPAFVRVTDGLLASAVPGVRLVNFGHLGDGNLHYNVQAPQGRDSAAFLHEFETQVNHIVFDSVAQFGGSISAEHGVGSLKVDTLPNYKSPVALEIMRTIKRALDPTALLNPGRVVRV